MSDDQKAAFEKALGYVPAKYENLGIYADPSHRYRLEGWIMREAELSAARAEVASKDAEIGRLKEALDRIANPIDWMRKDAEAQGCKMDGRYALALAQDHNYLSQIAEKALAGRDSKGVTDGQ